MPSFSNRKANFFFFSITAFGGGTKNPKIVFQKKEKSSLQIQKLFWKKKKRVVRQLIYSKQFNHYIIALMNLIKIKHDRKIPIPYFKYKFHLCKSM